MSSKISVNVSVVIYAVVATVLAITLGFGWYRQTQTPAKVVTKTQVIEESASSSSVSSVSQAQSTKKQFQSPSELDAYKSTEQKLGSTATQFAKDLMSYWPTTAEKRTALEKIATTQLVDQLAPAIPSTSTQANAVPFKIEWQVITPMIQVDQADNGLATVHMSYEYPNDSDHKAYNSVLLLKFEHGFVSNSQMFTGIPAQSGASQ